MVKRALESIVIGRRLKSKAFGVIFDPVTLMNTEKFGFSLSKMPYERFIHYGLQLSATFSSLTR